MPDTYTMRGAPYREVYTTNSKLYKANEEGIVEEVDGRDLMDMRNNGFVEVLPDPPPKTEPLPEEMTTAAEPVETNAMEQTVEPSLETQPQPVAEGEGEGYPPVQDPPARL